ncbi:MAG: hypothetical protein WC130_11665 [Kiritimatiellia bacterium]
MRLAHTGRSGSHGSRASRGHRREAHRHVGGVLTHRGGASESLRAEAAAHADFRALGRRLRPRRTHRRLRAKDAAHGAARTAHAAKTLRKDAQKLRIALNVWQEALQKAVRIRHC